jgi:hypothetical protein
LPGARGRRGRALQLALGLEEALLALDLHAERALLGEQAVVLGAAARR